MPRSPYFRLALWLLLIAFLAACTLMPLPTQQRSRGASKPSIPVQTASFQTQSDDAPPPPEMVEFPLMVETTPLSAASAPTGGQRYSFGPRNAEITTPATGSFELRIQSGDAFAVLDNDARDGSATVQVPTGTHDTRIQVQSGQLELYDELYYAKDSLSAEVAPLEKLKLTSMCAPDPSAQRVWRVRNANSVPVPYSYDVVGTDQTGQGVAKPGDTFFTTEATSGPNTTRLYVDGQQVQVKAAQPNACSVSTPPEKLKLTSMCSPEPNAYRVWRVRNPNPEGVVYTWKRHGTPQTGAGFAPPGDSYFTTVAASGPNTTTIYVNGTQQQVKAAQPNTCSPATANSAWKQLGLRPLPVPSDWHGPHGQDLVLKFDAQNVQSFNMHWSPSQQSASLPLGMAEIGPEGGCMELPGVAEICFPEHALSQKQVIVIRQESIGPKIDVMLSPIIRFEPFGLTLNKAALIRMKVNQNLLGKNHPIVMSYYRSINDSDANAWDILEVDTEDYCQINIKSFEKIKTLTKVFINMSPLYLNKSLKILLCDDNFQIQSYQNLETNLLLTEFDGNLSKQELSDAISLAPITQEAANIAWKKYSKMIGNSHIRKWFAGKYIPIHILKKPTKEGNPVVKNNWFKSTDIGPTEWYIDFPVIASGLRYPAQSNVQAIQHEVFHIFQNSFFNKGDRKRNGSPVYSEIERSWFLESSARYMGFKLTYDDFQYYALKYPIFNNGLPITKIDSIKINSFYQNLYARNLLLGLREDLQSYGLYEKPPESDDGPYLRLWLTSALSEKYGIEKLAHLNELYSKSGIKNSGYAAGNISSHINETIVNLFSSIYLRNFGIGMNSTSSFTLMNIIEMYRQEFDARYPNGVSIGNSHFTQSIGKTFSPINPTINYGPAKPSHAEQSLLSYTETNSQVEPIVIGSKTSQNEVFPTKSKPLQALFYELWPSKEMVQTEHNIQSSNKKIGLSMMWLFI